MNKANNNAEIKGLAIRSREKSLSFRTNPSLSAENENRGLINLYFFVGLTAKQNPQTRLDGFNSAG